MRKGIAVLSSVAMLAACQPEPAGEPVARVEVGATNTASATPSPSATIGSAVESACRSIIFENTSLTDCIAVPARHRIATALADDEGTNFRSLTAFAATRETADIAFAVNAGMFDDEGNPIGYFVEGGNRKHTLNTSEGEGNFHMRPNGVFFGTGDHWEVRSTEDFLANVTDRPDFGTQSGPMLVIDGKLHPEITHDGPSKAIRNGVGVDDKGRAHFVISNAPLSFGKLARFYRDELKIDNVLYLDGNVSELWNPTTERLDTGVPIGPILVVERKVPDDE